VSDETPEERARRVLVGTTPGPWTLVADTPWGSKVILNESGEIASAPVLIADLLAELDRLRHGEKVRDGEVCGQWCSLHESTADLDDDRCAYRRHWSVSGECTFSPVYREVAVLAALDTEEGSAQ
jgi:hypothetical protein